MPWPPLALAALTLVGSTAALRLPLGAAHVLLLALASLAGLALARLAVGARGRGPIVVALLVGGMLRCSVALHDERHSDDLYRYLWDGRVQQAGLNPYRDPPSAPRLAPLREPWFDRINHPTLRTVYPPLAELAFATVRRLPGDPARGWRLASAAAELLTSGLLWSWLRRRGRERLTLLWWCAPLVAWELWGDAHVDGLALLALAAALLVFEGEAARWRQAVGGAALGLSLAAKPVALVLLVVDGRTRRATALLALLGTLALAYASISEPEINPLGSLGEYGRRWRANAGAFAVVEGGTTWLLAQLGPGPYPVPRWLGGLAGGEARPALYLDEAAGALARTIVGLLWLGSLLALRRRFSRPQLACAAVLLFLLLVPTVHPWYVLWVLPFALASDGGFATAALLFVALAPLGYWPLAAYRVGGGWHEPLWTRLVAHGLPWALVLRSAVHAARDPRLSASRDLT